MSDKKLPSIKKAERVIGKSLVFRNAIVSDAEFILSLRLDEKKSRFLSKVSPDVFAQRRWLTDYSRSTDQAYFIIEHHESPIGTVRLYDARTTSFCWGSWILVDTRPSSAAMESCLMVYSFAVDHLGFSEAHFDVRKGNEHVWRFHERFGARRVGETELDYLYQLDLSSIQAARAKYEKILPNRVIVEP